MPPSRYEHTTCTGLSVDVYADRQRGNTFLVGTVGPNSEHMITSAKFILHRGVGATPGTVWAYLYASNGMIPTGSILASGNADGDSITTDTNGEWVEFNMSSYNLQPSTNYAIAFCAPNASATEVYVHYGTNNYAGGRMVWYSDAVGGWMGLLNNDVSFEIWGMKPPYLRTFTAELSMYDGTLLLPNNLRVSESITIVDRSIRHGTEPTPAQGVYVFVDDGSGLYRRVTDVVQVDWEDPRTMFQKRPALNFKIKKEDSDR